jgi:uncharacterized protein
MARQRGLDADPAAGSTDETRSGRMSSKLNIEGLIWLDEIVEKLGRKHRVEVHEVEEFFEGNPKFRFVERGNRKGEDVYAALGRSESGRYLIAFFIWKVDNRALPISARDMTPSERKRYARK